MSVLDHLHSYKAVGIDVETTGEYWYRDKIFGVAVAGWDGAEFVADYFDIRQKPRVLEVLKREMPRIKVPVVNHSIKFDCHMLLNEGIKLPDDQIQCVMVRAALIDEHRFEYKLDALAKDHLNERKVDIWQELSSLFGGAATRAVQIKNLHRAPSALAAKYATQDPVLALKLWLWQEEEIARQGLQQIWGLERRLTPVLVDVERGGIRVDLEQTYRSKAKVEEILKECDRQLAKLGMKELNTASPKQMREFFKPEKRDNHWYVGDVLLDTTDGGQPSLNKDALLELGKRGHPAAAAINRKRQYTKALQFFDNHILGHVQPNGFVYPNYNQTKDDEGKGTGTGRFSIDEPAMQQFPKRDKEIAALARPCFLPDGPKEGWLCADWEQKEFRVFAHYSKDPKVLEVYASNPDADFHQVVSDITGIPRNPRFAGDANAKQINLGLVFGMGQGKMAYEMGLDYTVQVRNGREWYLPGDKAKEVFATYHGAIPGVKRHLEKAQAIASSRGHVKTLMGRHIRFPNGSYHKAGGLVIQGTSADSMKLKMIALHGMSRKMGFRYLLSVHDEHDCSVPLNKPKLYAAIKKELETFDGVHCPLKFDVPIKADVKVAANWWEACK